MPDFAGLIQGLTVIAIPVLLAITLHEAAHAYAAKRLGDPTAYQLGRVTLNPLKHVDPFGTVLLPGLMYLLGGLIFGWAKPVPVSFRNLKNPRRDMIWVALAGPGTNLALALASAILLHLAPLAPDVASTWLTQTLLFSLQFNLLIAVFNMLPIPPLDGGRVAVGVLPDPLARPLAGLEPYGILIVMGVLFLIPFTANELGMPFNPVGEFILWARDWGVRLVATVTGLV